MSKLYKVTLFGKPFMIGWFSHADKWDEVQGHCL